MTSNDDTGATAAHRAEPADPLAPQFATGPVTGTGPTTGPGQSGSAREQVAGTAKEEAGNVAGTAKEQAAAVAGSAQEQAQNVLAEAKDQAGDLLEELRRQLSEQSDAVRDKLSQFLTGFGAELGEMASSGGGSGHATQLVRQLGDRTSSWGSHLNDASSGDLLHQTRSFARRRPGAFLLGALVAGVAAGRLSRGAKAQHDQNSASSAELVPAGSPTARPADIPTLTPPVEPYAGTASAGYGVPGTAAGDPVLPGSATRADLGYRP